MKVVTTKSFIQVTGRNMGMISYLSTGTGKERRIRCNFRSFFIGFEHSKLFPYSMLRGVEKFASGELVHIAMPYLTEEERDWFVNGGTKQDWGKVMRLAEEAKEFIEKKSRGRGIDTVFGGLNG